MAAEELGGMSALGVTQDIQGYTNKVLIDTHNRVKDMKYSAATDKQPKVIGFVEPVPKTNDIADMLLSLWLGSLDYKSKKHIFVYSLC